MENKGAVTYVITEHIGVLRKSDKGWKRELNLVSWNDTPAKYDLRDWNEDHSKCGRGITLNEEEMKEFVRLANEYFEL
ncbi:YdbC family protein [Eubacteriales bacterium KG127]